MENREQRITDRMELVTLRVGIARVCQGFDIETVQLQILGKNFEELTVLAKTRERGWNTLLNELAGTKNFSIKE